MTTPKTPTAPAPAITTAPNAKTAAVAAPPTNGVAAGVKLPPLTELPDPPQIPDMLTQMTDLSRAFTVLENYYRARPEVLVMGNCYLAPDGRHISGSPYPDCMVAFDLPYPRSAVVAANGYTISELGKPPDFVLEVASQSTGVRDYTEKREIYANLGVPEYWRFDQTGGSYHNVALAGDRLTPSGEYESLPITRTAAGLYRGYSAVLELELHWDAGSLRFWNPATGDYVHDISGMEDGWTAEAAARRIAEAAHLATADQLEATALDRDAYAAQRDAEAAARAQAESRAAAEAQARAAAEARANAADAAHQSTADQLAAAQELIQQLQAQQQQQR